MGLLCQGTVEQIVLTTEALCQVILDAKFQDNLMMLCNTKLAWLPIDDIILTRNLSLFHKICNGHGPRYLSLLWELCQE